MAGAQSTTLTRAQAAKYRLFAQVAAGVALLAAGGVLAMSVARPQQESTAAKLELRPLDPKKWLPPADIGQVKADIEGIASRMVLVSNSPKIAEVVKTDTSAPPPPPPFSLRDHVKYLGVVSEGSTLLALVAVDGKQRIVGAGDQVKVSADQVGTIDEITVDALKLTSNKKQETIEIAHRALASVSHGAAAPTRAVDPARPDGLRGADPRGRKPVKEAYPGIGAKNDAMNEENRVRTERIQREQLLVQRKAARQIREGQSGRSGDEVEKALDQLEQSGKLQETIDRAKKEKNQK